MDPKEQSPSQRAATEKFYSGALRRIWAFMLLLGIAGLIAAFLFWGWRIALGFLAGCGVAFLNSYWLMRVVSGIAASVTEGSGRAGGSVVARFLLRYLLLGLGAYVIVSVSAVSLYAFLVGVFLPVAGIFCETFYEVINALRQSMIRER